MAIIETRHLSVIFEKLVAVNDVSLQLGPGDLLGLIGPNGAGKTTLLRATCGLQQANGGSVWVMGERLTPQRGDLLNHVGFTSDTPPCYPTMTVRQFLLFIGRGYGLSNAEMNERIDFWLEKVWLKEKANTRIKSLSRGMRQRVGIARTLLPNPQLVVLDEPAAGLDPAGRVQFRQLLCELRDQGKALIVSSHILADMGDYCTHIGMMSAGRLIKFGTVAQVTHMHGSDRCRYTIILAKPVAGIEVLLAQHADISHILVENERIILEYLNDREAAATLLADLVHKKLPVASFTANPANLEEAYLRAGIVSSN